MLAASRRAIAFRICDSLATSGGESAGITVAIPRPTPPARAASTSRLTIRPCGPDPAMPERLRLLSLARRRASGDENTRPPVLCTATATGAGAPSPETAGMSTGCGAGSGVDAESPESSLWIGESCRAPSLSLGRSFWSVLSWL